MILQDKRLSLVLWDKRKSHNKNDRIRTEGTGE